MTTTTPELKHTSPLVYQCANGKIEVEQFGWMEDAILLPGRAEEWVWEPDQHHGNAVTEELLERLHLEAEVIVLGLGNESKLRVSPEVLALTSAWGPNVFLANTHKAIVRYNELVQLDRSVAFLVHSSC